MSLQEIARHSAVTLTWVPAKTYFVGFATMSLSAIRVPWPQRRYGLFSNPALRDTFRQLVSADQTVTAIYARKPDMCIIFFFIVTTSTDDVIGKSQSLSRSICRYGAYWGKLFTSAIYNF